MNYLVKCFIDVIYQYVVFRCIFPGFLSLVQKHIAMQHLSWKLMSLDGTIPLCRDFWLNCLSPVQEFLSVSNWPV
jgi:hypothetical protein